MNEQSEQFKPAEFEETDEFKDKKQQFFAGLGLRTREMLQMHKEAGLWGKKNSKEDWRNVSEHCLVEAARAEGFAEKLGLSEDVKKDLISAAVLHDYYKKNEIETYKAEGMTWDNYEKSEEAGSKLLEKKGFDSRIVRLAGSIGVIGAIEAKSILEKDDPSEEDMAYLILHYIDAYTNGSDWADASKIGEDGNRINNIDERQNASAQRYKSLFEGGRSRFNGEFPMDVEIRVDHLIESKIADVLNKKNNSDIISEDLPEFIDGKIREKIETIGK